MSFFFLVAEGVKILKVKISRQILQEIHAVLDPRAMVVNSLFDVG